MTKPTVKQVVDMLHLSAMRCTQESDDGIIKISGRPGCGKTWLALKAATIHSDRSTNVLYMTDELTSEVIVERLELLREVYTESGDVSYAASTAQPTFAHISDVIERRKPDVIVFDLMTIPNLEAYARGVAATGIKVIMAQHVRA